MRILIVEQDSALANSVCALLRRRGYEVQWTAVGETGAAYAALGIYDLLLVDGGLPGLSGQELTRRLRAGHCAVPILMLAACGGVEGKVAALNAGADYCLPRPFDVRELLASVEALLRRRSGQVDLLAFGGTTLDLGGGQLSCREQSVRLSAREFELMRLLLQAGERSVPKEVLLARVWGYDTDATENSVEVYVGLLRKKLRRIGSAVRIVAIRRVGYHLEAEPR